MLNVGHLILTTHFGHLMLRPGTKEQRPCVRPIIPCARRGKASRHRSPACRAPMAAKAAQNDAQLQESSSDSDEEVYTVDSAMQDWYFNKSTATVRSYKMVVKRFRKWLRDVHGKKLNQCKKKHVRAFFVHLKPTNTQVRPTLCVLKSLYKHLLRLGVITKDPCAHFKLSIQLPCRVERNLTSDQVRALFAAAQEKRDKKTFALLQCCVYSGIRIGALSRLRCADIIRSVTDMTSSSGSSSSSAKKVEHYYIHIVAGKCGKSRKVPLKKSIGKSLHAYAAIQAAKGVYLFPGRNGGPISTGAVAGRIKRLARKIGSPEISAHWLVSCIFFNAGHHLMLRPCYSPNSSLFFLHTHCKRHYFATTSLQNGCGLATLSKQMGHSGIQVTSRYCHAKPGEAASCYIDLSTTDIEESELTVEHKFRRPVKKATAM
jgi:site-specific recombinase XerD